MRKEFSEYFNLGELNKKQVDSLASEIIDFYKEHGYIDKEALDMLVNSCSFLMQDENVDAYARIKELKESGQRIQNEQESTPTHTQTIRFR